MRVLIINLSAETERMAFQRTQMAALGMDWERLEAVTPDTLSVPFEAPHWQRWERPMRAVEAAALASHVLAWERIGKRGEPHLVMEDDALLAAEAPAFLRAAEADAGRGDTIAGEAGSGGWITSCSRPTAARSSSDAAIPSCRSACSMTHRRLFSMLSDDARPPRRRCSWLVRLRNKMPRAPKPSGCTGRWRSPRFWSPTMGRASSRGRFAGTSMATTPMYASATVRRPGSGYSSASIGR